MKWCEVKSTYGLCKIASKCLLITILLLDRLVVAELVDKTEVKAFF